MNLPLTGGVVLVALATAFLAARGLIGSRVDAEGWLHEPFALIPLAWASGLAGVVLLTVAGWRRHRHRGRRPGPKN